MTTPRVLNCIVSPNAEYVDINFSLDRPTRYKKITQKNAKPFAAGAYGEVDIYQLEIKPDEKSSEDIPEQLIGKKLKSNSTTVAILNESQVISAMHGMSAHNVNQKECNQKFIFMKYISNSKTLDIVTFHDEHYFFHTCYKLALSIQKLHEMNLIHNDIKANNILLSLTTYMVFLIDFGITANFNVKTGEFGGDHPHIPYELRFKESRLNPSIDIFSLGKLFRNLSHNNPYLKCQLSPYLKARFITLYCGMISLDPKLRPNLDEVINELVIIICLSGLPISEKHETVHIRSFKEHLDLNSLLKYELTLDHLERKKMISHLDKNNIEALTKKYDEKADSKATADLTAYLKTDNPKLVIHDFATFQNVLNFFPSQVRYQFIENRLEINHVKPLIKTSEHLAKFADLFDNQLCDLPYQVTSLVGFINGCETFLRQELPTLRSRHQIFGKLKGWMLKANPSAENVTVKYVKNGIEQILQERAQELKIPQQDKLAFQQQLLEDIHDTGVIFEKMHRQKSRFSFKFFPVIESRFKKIYKTMQSVNDEKVNLDTIRIKIENLRIFSYFIEEQYEMRDKNYSQDKVKHWGKLLPKAIENANDLLDFLKDIHKVNRHLILSILGANHLKKILANDMGKISIYNLLTLEQQRFVTKLLTQLDAVVAAPQRLFHYTRTATSAQLADDMAVAVAIQPQEASCGCF